MNYILPKIRFLLTASERKSAFVLLGLMVIGMALQLEQEEVAHLMT